MSSAPAMEQTEQPLPPPYEGMSKAEVVRQRWKAKLKYKQQKELLGKVSCEHTLHCQACTIATDQTVYNAHGIQLELHYDRVHTLVVQQHRLCKLCAIAVSVRVGYVARCQVSRLQQQLYRRTALPACSAHTKHICSSICTLSGGQQQEDHCRPTRARVREGAS
jgi:hypothetical protein